ncbi:VOC family protein [Streptacidiphilus cavernicola]|uniref:VOC family protein n=1 Tax=Streptacidiphilus cavernicola TaxID=3342716 RepID=A0ABV6VYY4_9ACTN
MSELPEAGGSGVSCVPGAPSWVSLLARDPADARRFYGDLLGWGFECVEERWGTYAYAVAGGLRVAGVGALPEEWGGAPAWTVFFGTEDIEAGVQRVREHLGTVGIGPVDFAAGRVAVAVDPDNAVFGLWEGKPGPVQALRLPGAPAWMELSTDAFAAALFYGGVLDWAAQDRDRLDVTWEHERVVLRADGRRIAALATAERDPSVAPERPAWHVYFAVDDAATAAERATELGGTLVEAATGTPYGEVARLCDPQGAQFFLISSH